MAFELAADRRSVAEIPLKWGPYLAYGNVVLNGGAVLGVVGTLLRDLAGRPGVYCGRTDGRTDGGTDGDGNPR